MSSVAPAQLYESLNAGKQDLNIDIHFEKNFPKEFTGTVDKLGIVYSQLPGIDFFTTYTSRITPEDMQKPLMRHRGEKGISIHVENRSWHVPPRMDTRGMNEKTKKGHSVPIGEKCSAVFSIYNQSDRWQSAVYLNQEPLGTLVGDFHRNSFDKWDEVNSILEDTHPRYRLAFQKEQN